MNVTDHVSKGLECKLESAHKQRSCWVLGSTSQWVSQQSLLWLLQQGRPWGGPPRPASYGGSRDVTATESYPSLLQAAVCWDNPLVALNSHNCVQGQSQPPREDNTFSKHVDVVVQQVLGAWHSFSALCRTHTHPFMPFAQILASVRMDGGCRLHSMGLGSHTMLFAVQEGFTMLSRVFSLSMEITRHLSLFSVHRWICPYILICFFECYGCVSQLVCETVSSIYTYSAVQQISL